jgi:hypothetical protein
MTSLLAYIDAGTGSVITQVVVGGLAAAAVAAKLYWNRLLRFLHIRKDEPEVAQAESAGAKE